jgi:hypothetical protein
MRSATFKAAAEIPASSGAPPQPGEATAHARQLPKRAETNDMTPHVVEEYILETAERGTARIYHTRLTIYQGPILRSSLSAENFSDKFSISIFGLDLDINLSEYYGQ